MRNGFRIFAAAWLVGLAAAPLLAQETDSMAKDKGAMAPHGTFVGAEGHTAKGAYEIATAGGKTELKLGSDFSVEKGPDVYVVLSPAAKVPAKGALYLGKLSRFDGAQAFPVPAGTDLGAYTHVVLWCKKYSVAMGIASLAGGGAMMDQ